MLTLYQRIVDVDHMTYLVRMLEMLLLILVWICKNASVMLTGVFIALTPRSWHNFAEPYYRSNSLKIVFPKELIIDSQLDILHAYIKKAEN